MQKILIYGGTGLVGSRVLELLSSNFEFIAPTSDEVDLLNEEDIKKNIEQINPEQVLYAAGYTNVDKAEEDQDLCFGLNTIAVKTISDISSNLNIPLHYLSTDYVFNGEKSDLAYTEEDEPSPLSVYAKSKRDGEVLALDSNPKNSVIRLIMPYSAVHTKKLDLVRLVLGRLKNGEKVFGVTDQNVNPIFVDDLVFAIGKILENKSSGIYHVGASSFTTPDKFLHLLAKEFNLDENLITPQSFDEFSKTRPAKRPQHSWLDTSKFNKDFGEGILHSVEDGIKLFKEQFS
jgi:dTDP-4-dehydrorhamnose reductase